MYSYKGGAGRTVATANIASILAKDYGKKVVCIDLDIESAGLGVVFNVHKEIGNEGRKCLQDILTSGGFKSPDHFKEWWQNLHFDIGKHNKVLELEDKLFLIPSRFGALDCVPIAEEISLSLNALLNEIKAQIKPDYILLDSASGMGDIATTGFMRSDILLIFMRWSRQFIEGTIETIRTMKEWDHEFIPNTILIVPSAVPSLGSSARDKTKYDRIFRSNKRRIETEIESIEDLKVHLLDGIGEAVGLKWEEKVLNIQEEPLEDDETNALDNFRIVAKTLIDLK